jgi:hypothetical protein
LELFFRTLDSGDVGRLPICSTEINGIRRGISSEERVSRPRLTVSSEGGASLTIVSGKSTLLFGGEGSGVGGIVGCMIEPSGVGVGSDINDIFGAEGAGIVPKTRLGLGGEVVGGGPRAEKLWVLGKGDECRCWNTGNGTRFRGSTGVAILSDLGLGVDEVDGGEDELV